MLVSLSVRNLALVDRIAVDFEPGLNVITGETGAGKSILIGALGLILGERADKGLIRTGESSCQAEAVFQLDNARWVNEVLTDQDGEPCEDGQLVVRRVVKASGSTQNFINDRAVTRQIMKRVGRVLVDMHGPHDHQSLFDPSFQLEVLDAFGRHGTECAAYAESYAALQDAIRRKSALEGPQEGVAEQIDRLAFRIQEIGEASLDPAEEQALAREQLTLGHAQQIQELGQTIIAALMDAEGAAFDGIASAQKALAQLAPLFPAAEGWSDEARLIAVQIQELYRSVSSALEGIESDPARLQWLDDRIGTYTRLKRKYGGGVEQVLQTLQDAEERLKDLSSRGRRLAELEQEIAELRVELLKRGKALGQQRRAAAVRLGRAVAEELRDLGFKQGQFEIAVRDGEEKASELDDVEFGFAPNIGETMRPLRAIASSGEISRVMLALKGVLAALDRIPVLVFDEVDANLGGEMGSVVGRKLAALGRDHQVLCITHLPQVAVFGASHFAVSKTVRDGRTFSQVAPLSADERVEELARMLGGKGLTKVTLQHAREMLEGCR